LGGTPSSSGGVVITVIVRDSSSPPQTTSKTLTLTIFSALTISTASLPNGVMNVSYPVTTFQAQGGATPYTWAASGVPSGLNVSTTGILSGIPSSSGTFNLTITATDSSTPPQTTSKTLPLTIAAGLAITTPALPNGVVNQVYSAVTLQAQGGTAPYSWSATGLPAGLNLSS